MLGRRSDLLTTILKQNSLDYLFQLAVEMKQLGLPWITDIAQVLPSSKR